MCLCCINFIVWFLRYKAYTFGFNLLRVSFRNSRWILKMVLRVYRTLLSGHHYMKRDLCNILRSFESTLHSVLKWVTRKFFEKYLHSFLIIMITHEQCYNHYFVKFVPTNCALTTELTKMDPLVTTVLVYATNCFYHTTVCNKF